MTVATENLHFSVCHTYGAWTGEDVDNLVQEIKLILQKPSTAFMSDKFICNHTAFFNTDQRMQVLGVCPDNEGSAIHKLIGMLQHGLQGHSDIKMEGTIYATIINRPSSKHIEADNLILDNIITPLKEIDDYDWLGSLSMKKIVESRKFRNIKEKNHHQYYDLWEQNL